MNYDIQLSLIKILTTISDNLDHIRKALEKLEEQKEDSPQTIAGALGEMEKALLTPDNKVECYEDPEEDNEDEWLQYRNE